jgi:hypothetical protein
LLGHRWVLLRGVNTLGFQIASQVSTAISTFQPTPPPAVPLWTLEFAEFQPRGPCGSPGAGWRPWPPLDPPFRLHARPGKAVFCTGLHAPEVHPAPLSVATGGSPSLSQPTPKKMCASGGPAELASGSLAGRVYGPSNALKFRGAACGAHPRTLRFHVPCLPCGVLQRASRR